MTESEKIRYDRTNCPIGEASKLVGDKWVLQILRELFLGYSRFDEFEKNLGISRSVLSNKLKELTDAEVLSQTDYREAGQRSRKEYKLTKKGYGLVDLFVALLQWGETYFIDDNREHLTIRSHKDQIVHHQLSDENNEPLHAGQLVLCLTK